MEKVKIRAFFVTDGYKVHFVKQDELPIGGFDKEEVSQMQQQIAEGKDFVAIYCKDQNGTETDEIKFIAKISQILYIA